jgi:hypothetical protein
MHTQVSYDSSFSHTLLMTSHFLSWSMLSAVLESACSVLLCAQQQQQQQGQLQQTV